MELYQIYHPITAAPFRCNVNYMEFAPCDALKPYIRCFWGSENTITREKESTDTSGIVTPDTCMDIIFTVDYADNRIKSQFCGIDDRTFITHGNGGHNTFTTFAIRFYAWGVSMFAEESMKNTKNAFYDADYHFSGIKKEIEKQLFDITYISQFIPIAENVLLNHFSEQYKNPIVLQAVSNILEHRGNLSMSDLEQETVVGNRQLERLFLEYIGISPKSLASLVRYQYLWNELLFNKAFNIADAVYRYGYSDQAHLCHDFKKYHSMNMSDAKKYAMQNVGNIQYESSKLQYNN